MDNSSQPSEGGSCALPAAVNWDITYACPLRCSHCYSESGRRPSRQLPLSEMFRLADVIVSMAPRAMQISGGEPMLVKGLFDVAERLHAGGVRLVIYLSGFGVTAENAERLAALFSMIHVSVDGPDAETHDAIRGRAGSFDEAMAALAALDEAAVKLRAAGGRRLAFGIDCTVVRSNFRKLDRFCTEIAPRFPRLRFLNLRPALASGLASREGYAIRELLSPDELAEVARPEHTDQLRALAPASVDRVAASPVLMPFADMASAVTPEIMHIEPDGLVRGMPLYEGTVGNILEEPPEALWARVRARHADPVVHALLGEAHDMQSWAAAVRRLEERFAAPHDLVRIRNRPTFGEGGAA